MAAPSPSFKFFSQAAGLKYQAASGATVDATVADMSGVTSVTWSISSVDELSTVAAREATKVVSGSLGETVRYTAGGAGTAAIVKCVINGGINTQTGLADAEGTTATAKWWVPAANGAEVGCVGEELESDATFGWTGLINPALRGSNAYEKQPVRIATTTNDSLAGLAARDGVTPVAGDRVLVKDHATGASRGIYVAASGSWTRATDFDSSAEVVPGVGVFVSEGTANGNTFWVLTTDAPITLGTTSLTFEQVPYAYGSAGSMASVTKAAATAGTSGLAARIDHKHDVTTAAAGAIAVGDAAAEGSSASLARADHTHSLAAPAAPADVTKAAASAGAATTVARADHKHDISTAAPGTITFNSAAEGSATSLARSDHRHELVAPAAPANVTKAAASAGSSANVAREDHKHDVSTAAAVSVSTSNTEGSATSLARSDHTHSLPSQWRSNAISWRKDSGDSAAGDATAELATFRVPDAITITSMYYTPDGALTANDANYATLFVRKRDGAGGAATTLGSITTQTSGSGNWTAFVPVNIPITVDTVASGHIVTFEITKTGTGVQVRAGSLTIDHRIDP